MRKIPFMLFFLIFETFKGYGFTQEYYIIEKNNKKGLQDVNGNIIIPVVYENLGWSDGSSGVSNGRIGYMDLGLWGIINLENKKITSPEFISLIPVNNNILVGSIPDQYKLSELFGLIDYNGKSISGFLYNYLKRSGDYFIGGIRKSYNIRYGVINEKGNVTIPFRYLNISSLYNNLFSAYDESDKTIIYNTKGQILATLSVDEISPFNFGFASIKHHGKQGLIDKSGQILLEPEFKEIEVKCCTTISYFKFNEWSMLGISESSKKLFYDSLRPISNNKYIAYSGNNINLIDSDDSCYASFPELNITGVFKDNIIVKQKNKYGLLSSDGALIYSLIYDSIIYYDDYVLLKKKKDSEIGWLMGDNHGEILNYCLYEQLIPFNNSNILAKRKGYWGLLNNYGKEIVNCIYDSIDLSENGLIRVIFHNEEGLLWKYQWLVYPGEYQIKIIPDHQILINDYNGCVVLNVLGDTLYQSNNILIPDQKSFIIRNSSHQIGLLDEKFNAILNPNYSQIIPYNNDSLFVFMNNNGWGCVGNDGKIFFMNLSTIDSIISFSEGYFRVLIDGYIGFIDLNGKLRIANRYQDAGAFIDGIAPVKLLDHWGFINRLEQIVIQPFYDQIIYYSNHLIQVCKDEKYGIINDRGETIQDLDYDSIQPFSTGGFSCLKDNLSGFINSQGNLTVIPHYDNIKKLDNGRMIVTRNKKYGILSDTGEIILPLIYDDLFENPFNHSIIGCINSGWQKL